MKFDVVCLTVPPPGCGAVYVDGRISDDHTPGDQYQIMCKKCGMVGRHRVKHRLTGLQTESRFTEID